MANKLVTGESGTSHGLSRRTLLHLLLGVVGGMLLTPVIGGGLAGYLEAKQLRWGLGVGMVVGLTPAVLYLVGITLYELVVPPDMASFWTIIFAVPGFGWGYLSTLIGVSLVLGGVGGVVGSYVAVQ